MKCQWQAKAIGDVCAIKPPKSEARAALSAGDMVSFVPMENLLVGCKTLSLNQERRLSEVVGSYTYFADGDVLLAKITPCFENGKLGIAANLKNGVGFGSSEYIVLRPDATLNSAWLYYYLARESFRKEGASRMSGAVGHKRVPQDFIERYPIPVPPLSEQRRVLAILDQAFVAIDTARANADRNIANAQLLFECQLQDVFDQHSDGLERKRLSEVCDLQNGYAFKSKDYISSSNTLNIRMSSIRPDGRFDSDHNRRFLPDSYGRTFESFVLDDGDLIIAMTDMAGDPKILGVPTLVTNQTGRVFLMNQRVGKLFNFSHDVFVPYLRYVLTAPSIKDSYKKKGTGGLQINISKSDILSAVIPLPTIATQRHVAEQLDAVSAEVKSLKSIYEQKCVALDALRDSLTHRAFSGEL